MRAGAWRRPVAGTGWPARVGGTAELRPPRQLRLRLALLALWLSALAACSPFSPEIPLVITYRRSLLNEGYVVQLNNQSRRDLVVTIKLKSKDGRHKSETVAKLSAELTTEIGWLEGWRFDPGDSIRVIHPDFKDKTFEVP